MNILDSVYPASELISMIAWEIAHAPVAPLTLFLLGHGLTSLLFAIGAVNYLSRNLDEVTNRDHIFFLSLSFFIPILGILGLCWVLSSFKKLNEKDAAPHTGVGTAELLMQHESPKLSEYRAFAVNTGMLTNVLKNAPELEKRVSVLLATLRLPDRDAINILRVALRDSEDDVRLLAYALLSQIDKRYNDRIQSLLAMLSQVSANKRYFLHKKIAQEYWELVWVGLVTGETITAILDKSLAHAAAALEEQPQDAGLHFLLGKILIRLKYFEEAAAALLRSESFGMDTEVIGPYIIEITTARRRLYLVGEQLDRFRPKKCTEELLTNLKVIGVNV